MVCCIISIVARSVVLPRDSFSQLLVPQSMKYEILSNVHNHVAGAHCGGNKAFSKVETTILVA